MSWWSKRRRRPRGPEFLPRRELAPVEEIVEQGLLVADVAVRMNVKNEIIMNALKRGENYDAAQIADMVREATIELADERDRDAAHIQQVRDEISEKGNSAWSEATFRGGDNRTLKHRQQVYEGVAEKLREHASDENYVTSTAERAREAAWSEIGDSLANRATHPYYAGGDNEEYREARDERIQQLIEKDLTDLVREHGPKTPLLKKIRRKADD
ncbi:asparagine synthase [Leucobacter sp. GX24907]